MNNFQDSIKTSFITKGSFPLANVLFELFEWNKFIVFLVSAQFCQESTVGFMSSTSLHFFWKKYILAYQYPTYFSYENFASGKLAEQSFHKNHNNNFLFTVLFWEFYNKFWIQKSMTKFQMYQNAKLWTIKNHCVFHSFEIVKIQVI